MFNIYLNIKLKETIYLLNKAMTSKQDSSNKLISYFNKLLLVAFLIWFGGNLFSAYINSTSDSDRNTQRLQQAQEKADRARLK